MSFDRNTGAFRVTQKLPVSPHANRGTGYYSQAALLDDALVVTDARTVYVLRAGAGQGPAGQGTGGK